MELSYEVTTDDPGTWTKGWSMRIPFQIDNKYDLHEYGCHGRDYAMSDILGGARGGRRGYGFPSSHPSIVRGWPNTKTLVVEM